MELLRNAIGSEVCLQFSRVVDGSVAQLAPLCLLDDIAEVNLGLSVAYLDIGLGLSVGKVGDLIVFPAW